MRRCRNRPQVCAHSSLDHSLFLSDLSGCLPAVVELLSRQLHFSIGISGGTAWRQKQPRVKRKLVFVIIYDGCGGAPEESLTSGCLTAFHSYNESVGRELSEAVDLKKQTKKNTSRYLWTVSHQLFFTNKPAKLGLISTNTAYSQGIRDT